MCDDPRFFCDVHETVDSIEEIRKCLEEQSEMQAEALNRLADSAELIAKLAERFATAIEAVVERLDLACVSLNDIALSV